jgi:hypothetical protein
MDAVLRVESSHLHRHLLAVDDLDCRDNVVHHDPDVFAVAHRQVLDLRGVQCASGNFNAKWRQVVQPSAECAQWRSSSAQTRTRQCAATNDATHCRHVASVEQTAWPPAAKAMVMATKTVNIVASMHPNQRRAYVPFPRLPLQDWGPCTARQTPPS